MSDIIKQSKPELDVDRADPEDDDYRRPSAGGCKLCHRGNGFENEEMELDMEFDVFYHPSCLEEAGADTVLEWVQSL